VSKNLLFTLKVGDSIFQKPGPTRPNKRRIMERGT